MTAPVLHHVHVPDGTPDTAWCHVCHVLCPPRGCPCCQRVRMGHQLAAYVAERAATRPDLDDWQPMADLLHLLGTETP